MSEVTFTVGERRDEIEIFISKSFYRVRIGDHELTGEAAIRLAKEILAELQPYALRPRP